MANEGPTRLQPRLSDRELQRVIFAVGEIPGASRDEAAGDMLSLWLSLFGSSPIWGPVAETIREKIDELTIRRTPAQQAKIAELLESLPKRRDAEVTQLRRDDGGEDDGDTA